MRHDPCKRGGTGAAIVTANKPGPTATTGGITMPRTTANEAGQLGFNVTARARIEKPNVVAAVALMMAGDNGTKLTRRNVLR